MNNQLLDLLESGDLGVRIKTTTRRNASSDHILLYGLSSQGMVAAMKIASDKMGEDFHFISASDIEKPGDIALLISKLNDNDILFINNPHCLDRLSQEVLYEIVNVHFLNLTLGNDASAREISVIFPHFTLVAAAKSPDLLTAPLFDLFGIQLELESWQP